jgi:ABC-type dipeptide/oligopeptide/nickel transport system permease subunit
MTKDHPVRRAVNVLRGWLVMLMVMLVFNANIAHHYLLSDRANQIPFYFLAIVAGIWFFGIWKLETIITCCSIIAVGTSLRGIELLVYAEDYTLATRFTGATLWWFCTGTTIVFGVLNLIAASRRAAEDQLHGGD